MISVQFSLRLYNIDMAPPSIADLNGHGSAIPVQSHFKPSGQENGMTNHSEVANGEVTWKPTVIRPAADDVTIREEPFGSRKKMRIAILGAGISGINFFKVSTSQSTCPFA